MREVNCVKREKRTYNISLDELRKGEWLHLIPEEWTFTADVVDIQFKNNYLTIAKMATDKLEKRKSENGKPRTEKGTKTEGT